MKKYKGQDQRGFSLIELIIVIAIVVVLTVFLAPVYIRYLDRAREAKQLQAFDSLAQSAVAVVMDLAADGSAEAGLWQAHSPIMINSVMKPDEFDGAATDYFHELYGSELDNYRGWLHMKEGFAVELQVWQYYKDGVLKYSYRTDDPQHLTKY